MWETAQSYLFLGICFVFPVLFVVLFVRNLLRHGVRGARSELVTLARERGWREATREGFRVRYEASHEGVDVVIEQRRVRGNGQRQMPFELRARLATAPGCLVVAHAVPETLLRAVGGLSGALGLVDDARAEVLASLRRLDVPAEGRYVAYASADSHPHAAQLRELAALLTPLDRDSAGVVLTAWNGELSLLVRNPSVVELAHVEALVHARRLLERAATAHADA